METPSQVDSNQKSPATKTPTDNKDSKSSTESNVTESKSSAVVHSDSTKHQESIEKQSGSASNAVDTLSHPIISVDIQKGKPCDSKQADKTSDVPPEVIATVVTTAIVNEASLTVEESDGLVINGSKVSSDSSKVDIVVKNELDKLSETMNGKTELKTGNTVIKDAKPLPNGHIDQSPNDEAVTTQDILITDTKAQANIDGKNSDKLTSASVTLDILKVETSNETEAKVCTIADKNSNVETESCNGVPGIITVSTISKKDSNRGAEDVSGSEKHTKVINSIPEEEKLANDEAVADTHEVKVKPNECRDKLVDSNQAVTGNSNLTDSAKLNCNQSLTGAEMNTDVKSKTNTDSNAKQNDKNEVSDDPKDKAHGISEKETNDRSLGKEPNVEKAAAQEITSSSTEKVQHCDISQSKGSVLGDKSATSSQDSPQKAKSEITQSEMNMMMTSQILTEEDLNGPEVESSDPIHDCSKSADGIILESCRISATRYSPDKCDVGVGLDERAVSSVRVASGGGGEEEVDGQEATAEVEMTDDPNADNTSNSSMPGAASPASQTTPTKIPSTTSLSSAAASHKDEESRTTSAASRSSIPDAIVYEPPERRRSAVSEDKKSIEKSQEDEKETEKADTLNEETAIAESAGTEQKTDENDTKSKQEVTEVKGEVKDQLELSNKDTDSNIKETDETESLSKEDDKIIKADEEAGAENEKGVEDEKETERTDSKSETHDDGSESESKNDKESSHVPPEEADALPEKTEDQQEDKDDASSNVNPLEAAEGETVEDVTTKNEMVEESKEDKTAAESVTDEEEIKDSATELTVAEVHKDGNAAEDEKEAGDEKEVGEREEMPRELEEPQTLVGEEEASDVKDEVGEAPDEDEKEGADKGEEEEGKGGEEIEVNQGEETMKNGGKEVEPVGESQSKDTAETEEAGGETKGEEKNEDEDDAKLEKPDADNEPAEDEATDGKQVDGEEEEENGEKPEPPPRSPTKRMRSPDKAGRRGISPISSPPKQLKTPPSPQKPQKTTSPKKKNGTLSPIKTPKTPGSDTRKLPPIKAPVGLAPNPNLKNIRSKIGSFDNIKYKPGGGDKKVISKKLEWKASPKIGSLDHSYKGEKKHSKNQSKGEETKEEKQADGQSPAGSGDEAEGPATAEISETLLKQDSSEMPVAIAAES